MIKVVIHINFVIIIDEEKSIEKSKHNHFYYFQLQILILSYIFTLYLSLLLTEREVELVIPIPVPEISKLFPRIPNAADVVVGTSELVANVADTAVSVAAGAAHMGIGLIRLKKRE